jgi:alkyl hydroperoxide reductase subunit AhpC
MMRAAARILNEASSRALRLDAAHALAETEKTAELLREVLSAPATSPTSATAVATLQIGDVAPNFSADSTVGRPDLYEYLDEDWGLLFSDPGELAGDSTTEFAEVARLGPQFATRNVKVVAVSFDSLSVLRARAADKAEVSNHPLNFPIVSDRSRRVADAYGMNRRGSATPTRALFIIGPDKRLRLTLTYPAETGRNFAEVLRVIDSLQRMAEQKGNFVSPMRQVAQ